MFRCNHHHQRAHYLNLLQFQLMNSELRVKYIGLVNLVVWHTCNHTQIGRSLVRSQMMSLEFFIDIILPIALLPCGRLSL